MSITNQLLIVLPVILFSSLALQNVQKTELKPDYPPPQFVGTPSNVNIPNIDPNSGKPHPPFYVPVGTKNISLGQPVTSSDDWPVIGELEMVTDGDKEAVDGSYVELGPGVQHVTIDLGEQYSIYAMLVWHYHKQPRAYFDVIAQISKNPDFVSGAATIYNSDFDNSSGFGVGKEMNYFESNFGRLMDAKGLQGRYVRLYSAGNSDNDLNHMVEVEVHGKPVK